METELEQLIAEQQRDMSLNNYQPPERNTLHFNGAGDRGANIFDVADMKRMVDRTLWFYECAYHGKRYLRFHANGELRCGECERQHSEKYRRQRGAKPRPRCPHDETIERKRDCKECVREWGRAAKKNWYKTEKGQAYLKRKWAKAAAKRTPEIRHAQYLRTKARKEAEAKHQSGAA